MPQTELSHRFLSLKAERAVEERVTCYTIISNVAFLYITTIHLFFTLNDKGTKKHTHQFVVQALMQVLQGTIIISQLLLCNVLCRTYSMYLLISPKSIKLRANKTNLRDKDNLSTRDKSHFPYMCPCLGGSTVLCGSDGNVVALCTWVVLILISL